MFHLSDKFKNFIVSKGNICNQKQLIKDIDRFFRLNQSIIPKKIRRIYKMYSDYYWDKLEGHNLGENSICFEEILEFMKMISSRGCSFVEMGSLNPTKSVMGFDERDKKPKYEREGRKRNIYITERFKQLLEYNHPINSIEYFKTKLRRAKREIDSLYKENNELWKEVNRFRRANYVLDCLSIKTKKGEGNEKE